MTLIQSLTSLFSSRQKTAAEEYRAIIHRHDNPEPDDAQRIANLLPVLGITPDVVQEHIGAVERMNEIRSLATQADDLQAEIKTARVAFNEAQKRHDETVAKSRAALKAMDDKLHQTIARTGEAERAKAEVRKLLDAYPLVF